jgi:hypothetical protein
MWGALLMSLLNTYRWLSGSDGASTFGDAIDNLKLPLTAALSSDSLGSIERLILAAYERLKARYGQHLDGIPAGPITIIRLRAKGTSVEGFMLRSAKSDQGLSVRELRQFTAGAAGALRTIPSWLFVGYLRSRLSG